MPSAEAVEFVLATVPGVEQAHVESDEEAQGSLRIRVADGYDARVVAQEVSATLWERFSIELPPDSLLRKPAEPVSVRSPVPSLVSGDAETVVLYDAAEERATRAVIDANLPGWDDVLVRAQQLAAAQVKTEEPAATTLDVSEAEPADTPGAQAPEPAVDAATSPGSVETAPAPEEPRPPTATTPVEEPPVTATRSVQPPTHDTRVPSESGGPVTRSEVQIIDATLEGEGLGRRAVVVVNRTGTSGDETALGATLVTGDEAGAIAHATLQAVRNLDN